MVHLVKVKDEVFGVSGGLVRSVLTRYAKGELDYDAVHRELAENKEMGGDAPEFGDVYLGYLDFDAMKEQKLAKPIRVGDYPFEL